VDQRIDLSDLGKRLRAIGIPRRAKLPIEQILWGIRRRSLSPITDADFSSALFARGAVCLSLLYFRDECPFLFYPLSGTHCVSMRFSKKNKIGLGR
jgi:hypothetical protein